MSQMWTSTDWAVNRYKAALQEIVDLLGPEGDCPSNECEGCTYEMAEALYLAKNALGLAATRPGQPAHRKRETDASGE